MNITSVSANNFSGYYGKKGPLLQDEYLGYKVNMRPFDIVYLNKDGYPISADAIRTLAIQKEHPMYRSLFADNDVVEYDKNGNKVTAGDIRREFAMEEIKQLEQRQNQKINLLI